MTAKNNLASSEELARKKNNNNLHYKHIYLGKEL